MRSSICSLTNENRRPRIAAHILPLSATLALSHGSLTSTKYPRFRSIESVRQNVGFALYRPNETVYIRQANKTVCRYYFNRIDKNTPLANSLKIRKFTPLSTLARGWFYILSRTKFLFNIVVCHFLIYARAIR